MISHRTTARGTLVLALALSDPRGRGERRRAAEARLPGARHGHLRRRLRPAARRRDAPGDRHHGDRSASLALAVEAGKVEFWTSSATAGCMLYLHGASGTDYYYIHLNNDLSAKNDNRGKCVAGTAYAKGLKNGAKVIAGQPVGFVGDSGDANGMHAHLHFELHPGRGAAVDAVPVAAAGDAPALLGAARDRRSRSSCAGRSSRSPRTRCRSGSPPSAPGRCASTRRS